MTFSRYIAREDTSAAGEIPTSDLTRHAVLTYSLIKFRARPRSGIGRIFVTAAARR